MGAIRLSEWFVFRSCDPQFCNLDQGDGDGYGFVGPDDDDGYGIADGNGDSGGRGNGTGDGHGHFTVLGSSLNGGGVGDGNVQTMPMVNEGAPRTERIFRCAGCVGPYECSIHGRRI